MQSDWLMQMKARSANVGPSRRASASFPRTRESRLPERDDARTACTPHIETQSCARSN